jgi:hypothetical protein
VVVQKQVGQTMVQLPQVRQREATSSQCGDSRLAASISGRPSVRIVRPMRVAASATAPTACRTVASSAGRRGRSASTSAPAGVPARTRNRWTSPSTSSVMARSKPDSVPGPVPIEVQKQVAPGSVHSTAMTRLPSRRLE